MHNNHNGRAQDLLDRVLTGKPEETKARVLELVLRLGISPQDELFLVMIALGHLQLLVEDAPRDWQTLFHEFKEELAQWSSINLDTLDSIIRKSENELTLASTCNGLVSSLNELMTFNSALLKRLEKFPPESRSWNPTSPTPELSDRLQSIEAQQRRTMEALGRLSKAMNKSTTVKATVPRWLVWLLVALAACSWWNGCMLQNLQRQRGKSQGAAAHTILATLPASTGSRPAAGKSPL